MKHITYLRIFVIQVFDNPFKTFKFTNNNVADRIFSHEPSQSGLFSLSGIGTSISISSMSSSSSGRANKSWINSFVPSSWTMLLLSSSSVGSLTWSSVFAPCSSACTTLFLLLLVAFYKKLGSHSDLIITNNHAKIVCIKNIKTI